MWGQVTDEPDRKSLVLLLSQQAAVDVDRHSIVPQNLEPSMSGALRQEKQVSQVEMLRGGVEPGQAGKIVSARDVVGYVGRTQTAMPGQVAQCAGEGDDAEEARQPASHCPPPIPFCERRLGWVGTLKASEDSA